MRTIDILIKNSQNKVTRMQKHPIEQALRGIMAGVYISLGALFMLVVKNDQSLSPAISALLSGLVFSIGLIFVIVCEGELFTGNCLMIVGALSKKISWEDLWYLLIYSLLFNFVGCFIVAHLAMISGVDTNIFKIMMHTKAIDVPLLNTFGKSILCNILVCLAVWSSAGESHKSQNPLVIVMPVAMFVACGFEHSIADIFMICFCDTNMIPMAIPLIFLIAVIVGNVLGGFMLGLIFKNSYEEN